MDVPERGSPDTTMMGSPKRMSRYHFASGPRIAVIIAVAWLLFAAPSTAEAYIGPGAGFALVSSLFVFVTTVVLAMVSVVLWPIRAVWRALTRKRRGRASIKRLVVVGLDGQDPRVTEELLAAGKLPNFQRLATMGGYRRLRTTFPSVSPVAWSSFSTGTNPGRHNIFDFLTRDPRTYLPALSSARISGTARYLKLGWLRIPLSRPDITLLRRSRPFWSVLGEHGIWSTILRVPITFPPDRFYGAQLSAMSVPDLRGTQGTFTLYTTRPQASSIKDGGARVAIEARGDRIDTSIQGPENPFARDGSALVVALRLRIDRTAGVVHARVGGQKHVLEPGRMTGWIPLAFRAAPGVTVSGICRLLVTELGEHVSVYMTPINLDPDKPAMPISHPPYFATYLSKRIGRFATLGLAEDTSALNEGAITDEDFTRQAYDIDAEREAMLFASLDRLREGALVSVFDATDRIQHMFWRQARDAGTGVIGDLYAHNDALVGRVMARLHPDDLLIVLSDHGFTSFRRGVNLNGWLRDHGYLVLKDGADGTGEWLRDVDWTRTRAYALGLCGLFINTAGRERHGIVRAGADAAALKAELISKLSGLADPAAGAVAITEVFDTTRLYDGPYTTNAPDCLVGYNSGYRISWDSATGIVAGPVFQDNTRAWSGDHCIDPRLVPGVLFSSRPIARADPSLLDIAPTVLTLFGIEPPGYMEGTSLFAPSRAKDAAA